VVNEIIIATNNIDKVKEMKFLLKDLKIEVKSLKEVLPYDVDIEENGKTFEENAIIKAESICKMLDKIVVADDSGLEIDALNKEPGVHSARYLGYDTPYNIKNDYILKLLKDENNRVARYVCSMALAIPNEETIVFKDTMEGEIALKTDGDNGFGYDPIFYFPTVKTTVANMTLEEKSKYSHRAKALRSVVKKLEEMK
jgi:non-canonical purine NTP pyrophosphatase, rdgB/HAM1 family